MIVFEVHLTGTQTGEALLSAEILKETQAQVMTVAEATALGFQCLPDDPNLCLIAVTQQHARWIEKALERAPNVRGYRPHEVDM